MIEAPRKTYAVEIREYEKNHGSRLIDIEYFFTEKEARKFESEYNFCTVQGPAPSWYMIAEYVG